MTGLVFNKSIVQEVHIEEVKEDKIFILSKQCVRVRIITIQCYAIIIEQFMRRLRIFIMKIFNFHNIIRKYKLTSEKHKNLIS